MSLSQGTESGPRRKREGRVGRNAKDKRTVLCKVQKLYFTPKKSIFMGMSCIGHVISVSEIQTDESTWKAGGLFFSSGS